MCCEKVLKMETPRSSQNVSEAGQKKSKRQRVPNKFFSPELIGPLKKRKPKDESKRNKKNPAKQGKKRKAEKNTDLETIQKTKEIKSTDENYFSAHINNKRKDLETIFVPNVPEIENNLILHSVENQTKKKKDATTCDKCLKLKAQNKELQMTVENITLEKENLFLEVRSLKNVIKELKEKDNSSVLAGINEIKEHLKNQQTEKISNHEPNTTIYAGMKINSDLLNEAMRATQISSRVRKIAAGYWPPEKLRNVGAKKPPGVSKADYIPIRFRDYQNIMSVVDKLQDDPTLKIHGVDLINYDNKFQYWVQRAVNCRREGLSNEEDEESEEVGEGEEDGEGKQDGEQDEEQVEDEVEEDGETNEEEADK
ncbi:bromo and FHA domain-containing protein DDB_G0267958-like [Leptopilina heterotoma]|uniref:bromo and FHA domain-containing protein DDB_G0267958-like n=1 Tax=Leptopilina heterotoma TaxID=63436 RepID=UPI001CA8C257|nr:bromo and FHA domain-containing protein DDB_G0267958-like [Leptopilina heterotoma]